MRWLRSGLSIICFSMLVFSSSYAATAHWIGTMFRTGNYPAAVINSKSNVLVIWDSTHLQNNILISTLMDFGDWSDEPQQSEPIDLSAPQEGKIYRSSLILDPDENAIAIWGTLKKGPLNESNLVIKTSRLSKNSTQWETAPEPFVISASDNLYPIQMLKDSQGNALAAWQTDTALQTARYNVHTQSWERLADMPTAVKNDAHFQLAFNSTGNGVLIWTNPDKHILVSTLFAGEKTWSTPYQLTPNKTKAIADYAQVVIDQDSNITAAWETHTNHDYRQPIKCATLRTHTSEWKALADPGIGAWDKTLSLGLKPNGDVIAIWTMSQHAGKSVGPLQTALLPANTSVWSEVTSLSPESSNYTNISVVTDSKGNALAAWNSDIGFAVATKRSNYNWSAPYLMGHFGSGTVWTPVLSDDGKAILFTFLSGTTLFYYGGSNLF